MEEIYGKAAIIKYANMLENSCNIFSRDFYNTYYIDLDNYIASSMDNLNSVDFASLISLCDQSIGTGNNLGEIKLYTISQVLRDLGLAQLYVFCSDDKKARYSLDGQKNFECVSALGSFYLAKNYLLLSKDEAKLYYDSWMTFHLTHNQDSFAMYLKKDNQLEKVDGYTIFEMLYNDELKLLKNGHFCKNDLNE